MIGLLELGRGHIPERCEQAAAVVPRDLLEGREIDILGGPFQDPRRWISSVLNNPITVSANALS
jgi:hypothetical protein